MQFGKWGVGPTYDYVFYQHCSTGLSHNKADVKNCKINSWDLSGSPVVKTLLPLQSFGFDLVGTKDPTCCTVWL